MLEIPSIGDSQIFSNIEEMFQAYFRTVDSLRSTRQVGKGHEYDPGKYSAHVEKLGDAVYGVYEQTADDPDGDAWVAEIIDASRGLCVIARKVSEYRFYYADMFREAFAVVANFADSDKLKDSIEGWRWESAGKKRTR